MRSFRPEVVSFIDAFQYVKSLKCLDQIKYSFEYVVCEVKVLGKQLRKIKNAYFQFRM